MFIPCESSLKAKEFESTVPPLSVVKIALNNLWIIIINPGRINKNKVPT